MNSEVRIITKIETNKIKKILACIFTIMISLAWVIGVACLFTFLGICTGLLSFIPVLIGIVGVLAIFLLTALYIDQLNLDIDNLRLNLCANDPDNEGPMSPSRSVTPLNPALLSQSNESPLTHSQETGGTKQDTLSEEHLKQNFKNPCSSHHLTDNSANEDLMSPLCFAAIPSAVLLPHPDENHPQETDGTERDKFTENYDTFSQTSSSFTEENEMLPTSQCRKSPTMQKNMTTLLNAIMKQARSKCALVKQIFLQTKMIGRYIVTPDILRVHQHSLHTNFKK